MRCVDGHFQAETGGRGTANATQRSDAGAAFHAALTNPNKRSIHATFQAKMLEKAHG
jgi:hypothetical protein